MMFVCLLVCVGGSVGDGEQDGSSTSDARKRSKSKVTIHFDDKIYMYTVKKLHKVQFSLYCCLLGWHRKYFLVKILCSKSPMSQTW